MIKLNAAIQQLGFNNTYNNILTTNKLKSKDARSRTVKITDLSSSRSLITDALSSFSETTLHKKLINTNNDVPDSNVITLKNLAKKIQRFDIFNKKNT